MGDTRGLRLIVCGGRDYSDARRVAFALSLVHDEKGIVCVIQGGAAGADRHAYEWTAKNMVTVESYPADWKTHGQSAGPIRNAQMIREGKPDGVVAFPGGRGTADMVRQAKAARLKVWQPYG